MKLTLDSKFYAVYRLPASSNIPKWVLNGSFFSISKTSEELSIVCEQNDFLPEIKSEKEWRMFKVEGPLDFGLTGILASIANPLSQAKISIFAISTFDTDYVMVKAHTLKVAIESLKSAGFSISEF